MLYVVDDSADYRFLVQQVFKLFLTPYDLRLFGDGLELIDYVEQTPASTATVSAESGATLAKPTLPGLIILDVDMPGLGGVSTLERLKQDPVWQSIPVAIMSNRLEADAPEQAKRLGVVAYMAKPLGIEAIRQTMGQLCQQWLAV